jgi:membrane protease YdiL (CAAX protease family)
VLTPFDHVLFALLAFGLPAFGLLYWFPQLMRAPFHLLPRRRMLTYARAIAVQWTLLAAVVALWAWRGRDWAGLGFGPGHGFRAVMAWSVAAGVLAALFLQSRAIARRPELQAKLRAQLGSLWRMLPHTPRELRAFGAVSVTAGVCEEALYRGYMIAYLTHAMPVPAAVVGSGVVFGLGHAYQGPRGMLKTGLLGLVFATLYVFSGTVWPLLVMHAALDVNSGWLAYRFVVEREGAAPTAAPDSGFTPAPEPAITSSTLEHET